MAVKVTAIRSAAGSAKYTAMALSAGNRAGMRYIRGRSSTNFHTTATAMEDLALPMAVKVIWQATCMPNMNITAK